MRLRHGRRCDAELVAKSQPERVVGEQRVRAVALPGEDLHQEPRAALAQRRELDEPAGSALGGRRLAAADPEGREPGELERAHQQRAGFPAPFLAHGAVLAGRNRRSQTCWTSLAGPHAAVQSSRATALSARCSASWAASRSTQASGGQLDPHARTTVDRNDAPDLGEEGAQRRLGCVGCRACPEQLHERGARDRPSTLEHEVGEQQPALTSGQPVVDALPASRATSGPHSWMRVSEPRHDAIRDAKVAPRLHASTFPILTGVSDEEVTRWASGSIASAVRS